MSNFGFFDFLSFLLPGSVLMIIVYLICKTLNINIPLEGYVNNFSEAIAIIAGVTLSYFLGHLISFCRESLFRSKLSAADVLNSIKGRDEDKFFQLENINSLWFNRSLYNDQDNKLLDEGKCDDFFGRSFNLLEAENKMGKISVLYAQVLLFANLFFTFLIAMVFLIFSSLIAPRGILSKSQLESSMIFWGITLLIVAAVSYFLIEKRLHKFYNAVFNVLLGWNDAIRISGK